MKLAALTEGLQYTLLQGTMEKDVDSLIYFSEKAEAGSAFFAIPGTEKNGMDYIADAVSRGADTVILQEKPEEPFPQNPQSRLLTVLLVEDVRKALAHMSSIFYGEPCRQLFTAAVTGTKGKTSTAFMLREILEQGGIPTGLISTVKNGWEGHFSEALHTTPQSVDIQRLCRQMADAGCRAVVMEVSSQGLKQSRVWEIPFDVGIFTNLSPDHIGPREHETYEEYTYWKSTLFRQCRTAIIDGDTPQWRSLLEKENEKPQRIITFGQQPQSDYRYGNLQLHRTEAGPETEFLLEEKSSQTERSIKLRMAGAFQAENAAGAAAAARSCGLPWDAVEKAMKALQVPGRVETVDTGGRTCVMVDYAHNGQSLRRVLESLQSYHPKKLIVVFGCGGNRDHRRRWEMGRAAAELADHSILTSDNPRREKPEKIIRDIVRGLREAKKEGRMKGTWQIIEDREEAIRTALEMGTKEDIVLIAGKGHETGQLAGETVIPFDDREIIRKYVKIMDFQEKYNTGESRT